MRLPSKNSQPVEPIPISFCLEEGGMGLRSRLELIQGTFHYTPRFSADPGWKKQPSLERWISFRYSLDMLHVWNWQKSYLPAEAILDGNWWSLKIEYPGGLVIESSGSNAYPSIIDADYKDRGDQSLDWQLFRTAVAWLTDKSAR
jgi:hypothetical protein